MEGEYNGIRTSLHRVLWICRSVMCGASIGRIFPRSRRVKWEQDLGFQVRSPPCCCTRKQVAFKVLNTLLPPYPVTALFPIEEHLPIGKYFIRWPKAITPGLFSFQPLCFAALEPCFMPFLACHNKSIRPSYKYLVGCRLNCFALTHEMG